MPSARPSRRIGLKTALTCLWKEISMENRLPSILKGAITAVLVFQLAGCGTILYPERRGQVGGRLDVGVVVLDAIGLLFFLIPGIIAFAVDFSNGTIYLPAHLHPVTVEHTVQLRKIHFD